MVLGRYGDLTPAAARRLAEAARGKVQAGQDPQAERAGAIAAETAAVRRRKQAAEAAAFTFATLIERWAALGLADRSETHRIEAPRALRACFAAMQAQAAGSIDAAAAQRAVDRIATKRPVMARRARDYARAAFNWALRRHLVAANPFAAVTVEARERSRDRVLSDAELAQAWRAAGIMAYPFGPFFRLLILTLQRRGEVAGMRWDELAADLSLWTIPGSRTKNGKAHLVHLPPPAREILRTLPRWPRNPFVFSTATTTDDGASPGAVAPRPIAGFSDAAERLHAAMAMRWDQLTADHATRTIPADANKTGKSRAVRLDDAARALLRAVPRRPHNPYVFAGAPAPGGPRPVARRAATAAAGDSMGEASPAAGPGADWRVHDVRRTGVTVLARLGIAPHVADRLLNHVQGTIRGVAAVYQRHDFLTERQAAITAWAAHVLAVADDGTRQAAERETRSA